MLKLKNIYLGKTDAKNELLSSTPEEFKRFEFSFVIPPSLNIDGFINKNKYYVVGLKGTGKTALLRYIAMKLDEKTNSSSIFVLFKSDIDEYDRKDFSKASNIQVTEENSKVFDGNDFESIWRWFIYKKIAVAIEEKRYIEGPFQRNENLFRFVALMTSETVDREDKFFSRLIPKVRKGNIEISKNARLELEFDWENKEKIKINFNELVKRADFAFKNLDPGSGSLNIFFDELELNYQTKKQYQRDSRLVRDLIATIEKINAISKQKGFNLCTYAAIRSEVLSSVDSLGKEINKPIADFGSTILWNRPGLDASQQPLLRIIVKRINYSRKENGLGTLPEIELWKEYFPELIHRKRPQIYILHNSWYRPRDIVRLLITIQEQYPDEEKFTLQGFEAIRKLYSTESWVEITEELKTKYTSDDINGIKYIFYGYRQVNSYEQILHRADEIRKDHKETNELLKRFDLKDVLKDLYRVGVIGNINRKTKRIRFSFRGDDEILLDWDIMVHNALKAHLSIF